jgi:Cu/Ag efflux pump CusA
VWPQYQTLAVGLALIPIAAGKGQPGSEIQAPVAYVILFGLLSSTALNMLVVPSAYLLILEPGNHGHQMGIRSRGDVSAY